MQKENIFGTFHHFESGVNYFEQARHVELENLTSFRVEAFAFEGVVVVSGEIGRAHV